MCVKRVDCISNYIGLPAISSYYVHILETIHVYLSTNDFMKEFGGKLTLVILTLFSPKLALTRYILF